MIKLFLGLALLSPTNEPLKIGVSGAVPFVVNETEGIAVDMWDSVCKDVNKRTTRGSPCSYELVHVDTVDEVISKVESGELDGAIGPITITSDRLKHVNFSQPFYEAKMGSLFKEEKTIKSVFSSFFNKGFFIGLFSFLMTLFGIGLIIFAIENEKNEEIDRSWRGIFDGMWLSLVTLTTVGYGDKAPVTALGKIFVGCWMVIALLITPALTAFLATAIAFQENNHDLKNKRVLAVSDSTGASFSRLHGAKIRVKKTFAEAIDSLESGKANTLVFDAPALKYYVHKNPDSRLSFYEYVNYSESYGFIVSDQDLLNEINVSVLSLREEGKFQEIQERWMSE
jgi:polar amino acid transport system substrate-binding protein